MRTGPRQLLLAAYLLFTVAAGARSAYQLSTAILLPYVLSALAAGTYLIGYVLLLRGAVRAARAWCWTEFAGVLLAGTYSLLADLPDDTVWSRYGSGYGFVPLALPLLALCWLRSLSRQGSRS